MNISDFLAGTPVNAVLRERITLLLEDKERLDKQAAALQTENATLRKRITELERDVTAEAVSNEFVPHRGVFFKRKPTGGYDVGVYCPQCKGPMYSHQYVTPYHCSVCNVTAGFSGNELHEVRSELP